MSESNRANEERSPKISIEALKSGQEDAFIKLYTTAFAQPEADMIMPMMFPTGILSPPVQTRIKATFPSHPDDNPADTKFLALDPQTQLPIGVSWWRHHAQPPTHPTGLSNSISQAIAFKASLPHVEEMNTALLNAYITASAHQAFAMTDGKPYIELRILAVRKENQGKGIGKALLEDGLRRADEAHLPVLVVSSKMGRVMYEKYGFDEVQLLPLDCRDYGGGSEGRHWGMLRAAR